MVKQLLLQLQHEQELELLKRQKVIHAVIALIAWSHHRGI